MVSPDLDFLFYYSRTISILLIPVGLLLLLYGYNLFRIFLALFGFLVGFSFGFGIGLATGEPVLIALLAGAVGAILLYFLYWLGVFIIGGLVGVFLSLLIAPGSLELILVLFFACGILALFIQKAIIIFITSFQGAPMVISGFLWIFMPDYQSSSIQMALNNPAQYLANYGIEILFVLLLSIFGILYQYKVIPNIFDRYVPDKITKKNPEKEIKSEYKPDIELKNTSNHEAEREPKAASSNVYESETNKTVKPKPDKIKNQKLVFEIINDALSNGWQNFVENVRYASKNMIAWFDRVTKKRSKKKTTVFRNQTTGGNNLTQKQVKRSIKRADSNKDYINSNLKTFPLSFRTDNEHKKYTLLQKIPLLKKGPIYVATIGRSPEMKSNHICIPDKSGHISRFHAELALVNNRCYVRNLSQTNPLRLNGFKISSDGYIPIKENDELILGSLKLIAFRL